MTGDGPGWAADRRAVRLVRLSPDASVDSTRWPATPRITASPKSTGQDTVTVTMPPGTSPAVSVLTATVRHTTPAVDSALRAVDRAAMTAVGVLRCMLAARAAWWAASSRRSRASTPRWITTATNTSSVIKIGAIRVISAATEP